MDYDEYPYQPNGRGRSSGWEILPIWLYLVRNLTSKPGNVESDHQIDSRNVRLRRPPSLRPISLQTRAPRSLSILRMAGMLRPRCSPIRRPERAAHHRTPPSGNVHPFLRSVQRGYLCCGDCVSTLCERAYDGLDSRKCFECGGSSGFCHVLLDDGAAGEVCQ